jgi:hypothetical protein
MGLLSFLNPASLWNNAIKPAVNFTTNVVTGHPQQAFQDLQNTSNFTQAASSLTGNLQNLAKLNPLSTPLNANPLASPPASQLGQGFMSNFQNLMSHFHRTGGIAPTGRSSAVPATPAAAQTTPAVGAPGAGGPGSVPSSGPQANNPSTWNDNNAPYGVTLAGYSPQNHTNLTAADLASTDPASVSQNAKYLVYNYFLANQTQPTADWAPAAATALNAQYNTNIFHAIDGETLGYGNEYVHSAPNGYGMPQGTYNPSATGELFWGATS